MKQHKHSVTFSLTLLLLVTLLSSVLCAPVSAAAVNLTGVMDAHAYADESISADTVLPYRIYLPDALSPYFPAGADNASIVPDSADTDSTAEPAETEAVTDAPAAPQTPPEGTTYGLFIWLHDEDCRGNDNTAQIADDAKNGLMNAFLTDAARANDTIILAPQCPADTTWTDNDGVLLDILTSLVQNQLSILNIDPTRILIGGISMGAEAGYELIEAQTEAGAMQIAAAYLVAGVTDNTVASEADAAPYLDTDIYAFLSENDSVTPSDSVRALADTLITTYGCTFRYAVYPDLGHEIWHQAFAEGDHIASFLATNAPVTETVMEPVETEATEDTAPVEETPAETEAVTESVETEQLENEPLSIAGIEITSALIAYVILSAACILAVILLLTGLVKNSKVR